MEFKVSQRMFAMKECQFQKIHNLALCEIEIEETTRSTEPPWLSIQMQWEMAGFESYLATLAIETLRYLCRTMWVLCLWYLASVRRNRRYKIKWAGRQRSRHGFTFTIWSWWAKWLGRKGWTILEMWWMGRLQACQFSFCRKLGIRSRILFVWNTTGLHRALHVV